MLLLLRPPPRLFLLFFFFCAASVVSGFSLSSSSSSSPFRRRPLAKQTTTSRTMSRTTARTTRCAATAATQRPPYALSGLPRPKLRGRLMGKLHKSRAWYILACGYVLAAAGLGGGLAPRLALVAASSASVAISDGYHNPDTRSHTVDPKEELFWLRLDYVSISAILTTNLVLWAANLGWMANLSSTASAAAISTAVVAAASFAVVPRRRGHIFVKLTLAFQFVALLGYLVICALRSPMPWCSAIYFSYLPGFLLYATKWPKHDTFGYHEIFHSSVLLGHLASMGFDLNFLSSLL